METFHFALGKGEFAVRRPAPALKDEEAGYVGLNLYRYDPDTEDYTEDADTDWSVDMMVRLKPGVYGLCPTCRLTSRQHMLNHATLQANVLWLIMAVLLCRSRRGHKRCRTLQRKPSGSLDDDKSTEACFVLPRLELERRDINLAYASMSQASRKRLGPILPRETKSCRLLYTSWS